MAREREDDDADLEERKRRDRNNDDEPGGDASSDPPLPGALLAAIIVSLLWGGISLHASCISFSHSTMAVITIHRLEAQIGARFGGAGGGQGLAGTLAAAQFVQFLLAGALLAGGAMLLMRKNFAKFIAMGVPVAMILVDLGAAVICVIITKEFVQPYNFDFLVNIIFNLGVGGANAYLLMMDKNVAKVLK
ncbi:MAG: hypothetical protein HYR84_13885 [Planctomycetes bacterium]|nr:hypothetical protein [Planctomycetota bacterium]